MLTKLWSGGERPSPRELLNREVNSVLDEVGKATHNVNWNLLRSKRCGQRAARKKGSGIEFMQLRDYVQGQDEFRMVNVRASLRLGAGKGDKWIVRENLPEEVATDWIVMDEAPTHDFGGLRETKLKLCARAAATGALSTKRAGDLLGFIAYADNKVVCRMGAQAPNRILRGMVANILEPPSATGDGDSGLASAFALLPPVRSNVLWITDALNLTDKQKGIIARVANVHRLLVVIPQDSREWKLPEPAWWWPFPYRLKVFDLTTRQRYKMSATKANRELYTQEFEQHTRELLEFFARIRARCAIVHTEHEVAQAQELTSEELEKALARQRMQEILKVQNLIWSS